MHERGATKKGGGRGVVWGNRAPEKKKGTWPRGEPTGVLRKN